MQCKNCGNEIPDGMTQCNICGAGQEVKIQDTAEAMNGVPQYFQPMLQFKTNRSLAKMFFLSLVTFGIYGMVNYSQMVDELNMAACRYDGRKTMPYFAMITLTPITYGILTLVWTHNFSARLGNEARRRGYTTDFGAKDFWLWNVLGSLIIVGPFVYLHKLTKTMNMVNTSYNYYG